MYIQATRRPGRSATGFAAAFVRARCDIIRTDGDADSFGSDCLTGIAPGVSRTALNDELAGFEVLLLARVEHANELAFDQIVVVDPVCVRTTLGRHARVGAVLERRTRALRRRGDEEELDALGVDDMHGIEMSDRVIERLSVVESGHGRCSDGLDDALGARTGLEFDLLVFDEDGLAFVVVAGHDATETGSGHRRTWCFLADG